MNFNKVNVISFFAFGIGGFVLVIGAAMAGFGNAKIPHREYDSFFDGSYESYENKKSSGKSLAIAGYVFITIGVIAVVVSMSVRCYLMSGGFKDGNTAAPGVATYNAASTVYAGPASGGYQATGPNYPQNAGPGYPPPSTYPPGAYPSYSNPSDATPTVAPPSYTDATAPPVEEK